MSYTRKIPTFEVEEIMADWFDDPPNEGRPAAASTKQADAEGNQAIVYNTEEVKMELPNGDTARVGDFVVTDSQGNIQIVTAARLAADFEETA